MLLYVLIRDRNNLSVSGNSYSSFKPMNVGFVSFFLVGIVASLSEPNHLWPTVLAATAVFVITFFIAFKTLPWFHSVPDNEQTRIRTEQPKDAVLWQ